MQRFLTRVELHRKHPNIPVDGADYERLHIAMIKAGFKRTITGDDRVEYHLPTAEYYIASDLLVNQINNLANKAAGETGYTFESITVMYSTAIWTGLKPVR